MSKNTHPNTPFGKFFFKIGIWRPSIEDAIKDLYDHLHDTEKEAIKKASGWIAVVNANLDKAPDVVFDILHTKFPDITRESITEALNKLNTSLLKIDESVPEDFDTALGRLQAYLRQFEDKPWMVITRSVVTLLSDILLKGATPIQTIETVLEFVYRTFIKGKVVEPATA